MDVWPRLHIRAIAEAKTGHKYIQKHLWNCPFLSPEMSQHLHHERKRDGWQVKVVGGLGEVPQPTPITGV